MAGDAGSEPELTHETIYKEASDEDKGILAEIDFDLRDTGRWLLKVIGGPNNGAEFSMQPGSSYVIGTDPATCDIIFHDTSVSRQHARITIAENNTITLEDLKSRNGTLIDGEKVQGKRQLEPNTLVTLGTTAFLVFDREGDMQTIISPLLPSIVKVLKGEEEKKQAEVAKEALAAAQQKAEPVPAAKPEEKPHTPMRTFVLIGIITAVFVVVGVGTTTLFQSAPVLKLEETNANAEIETFLAPYSSIKWSFDKTNGNLLLVGHVLTTSDKNQLLFSLQNLKKFVKNIDDGGVIIDEYVWRETNQFLSHDPRFKGISIHAPSPGVFVLDGFLQTRKQAEELNDYITANFPYLDLLERRVAVGEDVKSTVNNDLENAGIKNVKIQIDNQELSLSGTISQDKAAALDKLVKKFREIPGVRGVKTFISENQPELSVTNISDQYKVSGGAHQGGVNINVVINGRILMKGDILDGMTITSINPNRIMLEKEGSKYEIDYNQ